MSFAEQKEHGFMRIPKWMPWQDKLSLIVLKLGFFFFLLLLIVSIGAKFGEAKAFTNATHNILWVYGNQIENLSSISRQVGNASLQRLSGSPNVYVLFEMMVFNDTKTNATFSSRVDGAYELRLNGSNGIIFISAGQPMHLLNLSDLKIRSWNNNTGNEIPSTGIPKGFIRFGDRKAILFAKNLTTSNLGNLTSNYRGLNIARSKGSRILNSNFSGGYHAIFLTTTQTNNTIINNSLFHNQSSSAIVFSSVLSNNVSFSNFTSLVNALRYEGNTGKYNRVFKNYFYNFDSSNSMSAISHSSNNFSYIYQNMIKGNGLTSTTAISILLASNNIQVYNNTYNFTQYGISINQRSKHINITWNKAYNNDHGLGRIIGNSSFIRIYNNTVFNSTVNYDSYDEGLKIRNASFIWIIDNNFSKLASTGIHIQGYSKNITIKNNNFSFIPLGERSRYLAKDWGMPPTAIWCGEIYKTFLGEGLEIGELGMISFIRRFNSTNIMIRGNTFDSNTMVLARLQGCSNVDYDFTNYWFRSFQAPVNLLDRDRFFISNDFNNLSSYHIRQRDILSNSYVNYGKNDWKTNYTISKYAMSFINLNFTNSSYRAIALFNVSGYKIINVTNGTVLTLNSGATFNISALPGRKIVAFNGTPTVTEGIIGFFDTGNRIIGKNIYFTSSSTSTLKKIASNLSQAINTNSTYNATSCSINNMVFTSATKAFAYTIQKWTCATSQSNSNIKLVTANITNLEPTGASCASSGTSCNEIAIFYSSAQPIGSSGGPQGTATTISNQTNATQQVQPKDLTKRDNSLSVNKPIIIYIILGVIIIISVASYLSRNQLKKLVKKAS